MTVPIDNLTSFDLDELEHLDETGLREHFLTLASDASEGQLRSILGLPLTDQSDLGSLSERFAERFVAAALRLRSLREEIDLPN